MVYYDCNSFIFLTPSRSVKILIEIKVNLTQVSISWVTYNIQSQYQIPAADEQGAQTFESAIYSFDKFVVFVMEETKRISHNQISMSKR